MEDELAEVLFEQRNEFLNQLTQARTLIKQLESRNKVLEEEHAAKEAKREKRRRRKSKREDG